MGNLSRRTIFCLLFLLMAAACIPPLSLAQQKDTASFPPLERWKASVASSINTWDAELAISGLARARLQAIWLAAKPLMPFFCAYCWAA